jgi:5,10-methylene-tetrahydrofolate dehydrogenase/methenyl tetrahydrofolate cyclohydrolase
MGAQILANAGWNPPMVEGDALKPRKVVIDAPTTVQKRIFSFDSPTSLPSRYCTITPASPLGP